MAQSSKIHMPPEARIISELRSEFRLENLPQAAGMARSTYHYQCKVLAAPDRHAELKVRIQAIHEQSAGAIWLLKGHRCASGGRAPIDGKTVRRLMLELGLEGRSG